MRGSFRYNVTMEIDRELTETWYLIRDIPVNCAWLQIES